MTSPYQEFVLKAKARFQERQKRASGSGAVSLTRHAQFKMRQYGLSEQKVRSVIRNPKRREEGIVKDTIAVMQPVSPKRDGSGKETWKQEIWVMFQQRKMGVKLGNISLRRQIRIISAWRYPGVSPKRNPIPEEILRELSEGSIMEADNSYE